MGTSQVFLISGGAGTLDYVSLCNRGQVRVCVCTMVWWQSEVGTVRIQLVQLTFPSVKHHFFLFLTTLLSKHAAVCYIHLLWAGGRADIAAWFTLMLFSQAGLQIDSEEACVTSEGPEMNWAAFWYIHHRRDTTSTQSIHRHADTLSF